MVVERKESYSYTVFRDIKVGETFRLTGEAYIKIKSIDHEDYPFSAVKLETGEQVRIGNDCSVIKIDMKCVEV